ncbi:MAG: hypothetical protein ABIR47_00505 [Candidatus Kapaibacterium sp.]
MNIRNTFPVILLAVGILFVGCSSDPASGTDNPSNTTVNVKVMKDVKISAQASTISGNLYDVEKDSAYRMNFYSTKKTEIDFIYYYGSGNGDNAAIVSPDYEVLSNGSIAGNYSGYATPSARVGANVTQFKKLAGFTVAQFDAVNDSAAIATAYTGGGTADNKASNLIVGDVVAFRTANGTDGLFKVTDFFTQNAAGYVTITIKTRK